MSLDRTDAETVILKIHLAIVDYGHHVEHTHGIPPTRRARIERESRIVLQISRFRPTLTNRLLPSIHATNAG